MNQTKNYIAVDLGAESGRVMLGQVGEHSVSLTEVHRFSNGPVDQDGSLRWDFGSLFGSITEGIAKAIAMGKGQITAIAVDSWGVDFGLLDANGELIENPYHYRDSRTDGVMAKAFELMPQKELYDSSGIQFMQLNTIFQLLAMRLSGAKALHRASKLVFMADLVTYFLCGKAVAEYTLASTSQLMNMKTGQWSAEIFKTLGLPQNIMPEVKAPGTTVGNLKQDLCDKFKCQPIPVVLVGSHDTASAVAAVPATQGDNWAYLSCGTWSLLGVEVPKAIINDQTHTYSFTNEGGVENTIRLLKNIMGLWLLQECRRQWQREGVDLDYAQLQEMAAGAKPFAGIVNPNDSRFFAPGDMPSRIREYIAKAGKGDIADKGQIARIILESLAFNYRYVVEKLEAITGRHIEVLHIIGGGSKNELLCQFAANALNRKVITGPVEATAIGNIMVQAIAAGQFKSLDQCRKVIGKSVETRTFMPQDAQLWQNEYAKIANTFVS